MVVTTSFYFVQNTKFYVTKPKKRKKMDVENIGYNECGFGHVYEMAFFSALFLAAIIL